MINFLTILILIFSLNALTQKKSPLSSPIPGDDFLTLLQPLGPNTNIYQLEKLGLAKGNSLVEPWTGSYWPIHKGILGFRYAGGNAIYNSKSFSNNVQAWTSNPPEALINAGDIDKLSPSEKYDLLVGDTNWSLSRSMWKKGESDLLEKGIVAQWTGICHGWAAVSQMALPPPLHSIVVRDVTGHYSITFYASDIKGLLSFLWAESPPETQQAGHRCYQGPIVRDTYLRPVDSNCLDTNPMTWHLAITNRLGRYGKSFVMDSSIGPEVWNYPLAAYDYSYFNPRTFQSTHSFKLAVEPVSQLTADRYAELRNVNTKFVVGINMDVFHPALTEPTTTNNSSNAIQSHTFIYDLELNEDFDIIGGEWYSEDQPDFIWTMSDTSQAQIREDLANLTIWDTELPMPTDIATTAISASHRGKVMATIVNKIREKSMK